VKRGVRKSTNHEPKAKLGTMAVVMPRSLRAIRGELKRRAARSTRVPAGAFGKNDRPRVPFDQRPTEGGRNYEWKFRNYQANRAWHTSLLREWWHPAVEKFSKRTQQESWRNFVLRRLASGSRPQPHAV
jgi:hypothetical protein